MPRSALAFALTLTCAVLVAAGPARAQGQPDALAVNFAALRTSTPSSHISRQVYPGFGIEFTAPLHNRWSLDAEADFLSPLASAWLQETLVGVRYRAAQGRRWAFYLTARPGWIYINSGFGSPFSSVGPAFNFAFGLGGTAELRLSRRWLWRFRAGDLLIHGSYGFFPANNLQLSTGLALRF